MSNRNKSSRAVQGVRAIGIAALLLSPIGNSWAAGDGDAIALENMSINDLMQIEVSSVSRKAQTLANTAAAAFIITQEDIRRSGATSIPEALRYVPGLEVAQGASHTWDITARGFNSGYANKLLVLIDGRAVYTPIYAGVIWELQDTMMEDIERIEVIRGPGAAMWGSNAVNGVINVITKKTKDTRGDLLVAGTGNQESGFAGFRHGGSFEDGSYRVYGKGFSRDATVNAAGARQDDAWRSGQIGFRMDRRVAGGDGFTLQGDAYKMNNGEPLTDNAAAAATLPIYSIANYIPNDASVHGGNLLARWESTLSNGSEISLQGYYDRAQINALFLGTDIETYDLDFQHRLHPNAMNDLMWGANYRHIHNTSKNTPNMGFAPASFGYQNVSVFAQDDIALVADRLRLTLGAKLEDSYFAGMQFQPNARLLWTPDNTNSVWLSASQASRTPSLVESVSAHIIPPVVPPSALTGGLPVKLDVSGNSNLKAEKVTALEAGYRTQWNPRLSTDIAIYFNNYHDLTQSVQSGATQVLAGPYLYAPMTFSNAATTTQTHGLEMSADWRALDWMRLEGTFTYAKMNAPPWDGNNTDYARLTPRTQESLRCLMDLNEKTKLNLALRHVGALDATTAGVPAYYTADANVAYTPRKGLDISLVGQNLLGPHVEFVNNSFSARPPSQIRRSIYAKVTWSH